MRYLDADVTREALSMSAAIEAMVPALSDDRETPLRNLLGSSLFISARVGSSTGIEVVSTVPGKPCSVVAVFDDEGACRDLHRSEVEVRGSPQERLNDPAYRYGGRTAIAAVAVAVTLIGACSETAPPPPDRTADPSVPGPTSETVATNNYVPSSFDDSPDSRFDDLLPPRVDNPEHVTFADYERAVLNTIACVETHTVFRVDGPFHADDLRTGLIVIPGYHPREFLTYGMRVPECTSSEEEAHHLAIADDCQARLLDPVYRRWHDIRAPTESDLALWYAEAERCLRDLGVLTESAPTRDDILGLIDYQACQPWTVLPR
ncbi:MAG: hypothetical protein WEA29_07080 [Acidimicrobiia bacterium]